MKRFAAIALMLVAIAACSSGSKPITATDCAGGVTVLNANQLHAWTTITTGDTWPNADAPVWHEGKPPNC